MNSLLQDITHLWRTKWSFRLALLYLGSLFILVLLLPFLPFRFSPNQLDLDNIFLRPFENNNHWLGTDQLGRDVMVNTFYGARNGLLIALPVMLLSSIIGTALGAVAGYFGNYKLYLSWGSLLLILCSLLLFSYYGIYLPLYVAGQELPESMAYTSVGAGVSIGVILWFGIRRILVKWSFFKRRTSFPVDSVILRTIELVTSLPKLLIVISVAAFAAPSVMLLSLIFICTYWTGIARLARAEMLRLKELPYMEAARSIGMTNQRIILKEAIPNLINPIVVAFIFGVGGLLAIESTLSFLGIGLPSTFPSWGRTIAGIRSNLSAWWLVAFPGGFLALTLLALQTCTYFLVRITQEKGK